MNKHGFKYVRKINDGRPKPYLGRIAFGGVEYQTKNCATPQEASEAAIALKALAVTRPHLSTPEKSS